MLSKNSGKAFVELVARSWTSLVTVRIWASVGGHRASGIKEWPEQRWRGRNEHLLYGTI